MTPIMYFFSCEGARCEEVWGGVGRYGYDDEAVFEELKACSQ